MATFASNTPIEVGYWSIRGLAAPLRMMVMYTGHPLQATNYDLAIKEDGSYDGSCWFNVKPALKDINPLVNLPYIKDGNVIVSQSNACFTYLGRKLNLLGSNDIELSQCEQLLCEIMDIRNAMTGWCYSPAVDKDTASKLIEKVCHKTGGFDKLEQWLIKQIRDGKSDGTTSLFLVGNSATAPDFHLYEMLTQFYTVCTYFGLVSLWDHFPTLHKFHHLFHSLPQNQKYLNSVLARKLPFNNKSARFGATLNHDFWNLGNDYDFKDTSGVY